MFRQAFTASCHHVSARSLLWHRATVPQTLTKCVRRWLCLAAWATATGLGSSAQAASLYQDGAGGRAKGMGGAGTAVADDPLSALFDNPAALCEVDQLTAQLDVDGAVAQGSFHNRANQHTGLGTAGAIGEFAASVPWGPLRFAVGVNPDIAAEDNWHYRDAPGGADGFTTYGVHDDQSEVLLLRSALGASWQVTRTLSVGANVGLLYNENYLHTPYVFQSQPVLRGVKTLLDLRTDGFGWNAQTGVRWRPIPSLALSASYTSGTDLNTHGRATGNAGVQLANLGLGAARPAFAYEAEVDNSFPQRVSAGVSWQTTPHLTLSAQFDWINWSNSFDTLPVRLTNGNNADLNGLVGSRRLDDNIPLRWDDQFVGRVGAEQRFGEHWSVRGGYAYANNPVPDATLTPLNAAITEHLLTAGAGYRTGPVSIDAYFQWQIPATARVRTSGLASGEYSDSVTEINVEQFGLTVKVAF